MRLRRIISVVALLGVLLHAAAIARHNGAMVGAILQYLDLAAGYAQICHSSGEAAAVPGGELPFIPKPTGNGDACPICSGLGSTYALTAPALPVVVAKPIPAPAYVTPARLVLRPGYAVVPPARGPPARA